MPLTEFDSATGARTIEPSGDDEHDTFAMLDIAAIVPSPTNPRTVFDDAKLLGLSDSIEATGVHQPILVRPLPPHRVPDTHRRATHEIVSGERRWRASRLAERTTIPAMIRKLTDAQVLEIQVIENLQREDLTELEEAEGYRRLVESAGLDKETIGAKIGKSREYVYSRLKLIDLCIEGRDALREGKIDFSRALLIARIPDHKLQLKALAELTRFGFSEGMTNMSLRDFQTWLRSNVLLSLKRTSFDIADTTLTTAGSCGLCPKRTGAAPELFRDVQGEDLCTDPACYHNKEHVAGERRFEEAKREGKKTIDAEQAKKLTDGPTVGRDWLRGYYQLDAYPHYNLDVHGATLRKVLGKYCPEPVLVEHPETHEILEMLPIEQVKKLIGKHGLSESTKRAAGGGKSNAVKKPLIEERLDYKERWQDIAIEQAAAHIRREPVVGSPEVLRAWLTDNDVYICAALDISDSSEAARRIANMSDADLPRLLLLHMLYESADSWGAWDEENAQRQGPRTVLFEILHMAGVDLAAIKAEVKRAMESEERAEEEEAKAEKEKAKPAGKKPKEKK
jgi:ParB/RepB/Spo0J family partition protein